MKGKYQQGMSSLSLLVLLAVIGFFLTALFKLGPLYLDNYFVSAAIKSLKNDKIHDISDAQIRRTLDKLFTINGVRDITAREVKVDRQKTHTIVSMEYEKRVAFMGNVDVVVKFKDVYDTAGRD